MEIIQCEEMIWESTHLEPIVSRERQCTNEAKVFFEFLFPKNQHGKQKELRARCFSHGPNLQTFLTREEYVIMKVMES
jgi:hypothetical protein